MNAARRFLTTAATVEVRFYFGLLMLALLLGILTYYIDSKPDVLAPVTDTAAWSKALDTYAATGNLLITLATGVLAGIGWFFTSKPKKQYSARDIWPAIVEPYARACQSTLAISLRKTCNGSLRTLSEHSIW